MAEDTPKAAVPRAKAASKAKTKAEPSLAAEMPETMSGHDADTGASNSDSTFADTAEKVKSTAAKLGKDASGKARALANDGKARAGGALDEVSRMMGEAAGAVDKRLGEDYGNYARSAADRIAGLSEQLKAKDIDDFVDDAREFVRKSPAMAIGIAAAVGFVLARLVRAGSRDDA